MTRAGSLAVHVCSRDAPDRAATLLADLAEVVGARQCSVTVYDDSTTDPHRASYREACAGADVCPRYFGERDRVALVAEAQRSLGIDHDLTAGSRPFGQGRWDLAGCRFTAMLDAAMDPRPSTFHLFLDDDLRLVSCRYAGRDFAVDTAALRRQLFDSLIPDDRLFAAGVAYSGRADIALLEHLHVAGTVNGPIPAMVTSLPFVHPDSPGFSGGFLLTNRVSLRSVPLSRWYDEDWIWLRQLQLTGAQMRRIDTAVVHAGDPTIAVSLASLRHQFQGEVFDTAVRLCAEAGRPFVRCREYVPEALELQTSRIEAMCAPGAGPAGVVLRPLLAHARATSVVALREALRSHVDRSERWARAFAVEPVGSVNPMAGAGS